MLLLVQLIAFIGKFLESDPGFYLHAVLNFQVSLNLEKMSESLFCHHLDTVKNTDHLFCSVGFIWCFLFTRFRLYILGSKTKNNVVSISVHSMQRKNTNYVFHYWLTLMAWLRWCLLGFSSLKLQLINSQDISILGILKKF